MLPTILLVFKKRINTVSDMKSKVTFPKETDSFLLEVNKKVQEYFIKNNISKQGNSKIIYKYFLLKFVLIVNYVLILNTENLYLTLLLFSFLGPIFIILAINIAHDAIHGVANSNKTINRFLRYQMDLVGANSFAWKRRHKIGHHSFPNILSKDPDLRQTKIVRIFPNAPKLFLHRFQHIYVPILYSIYTINWIFIRDFYDFFSRKSIIGKIPYKEFLKLFIFKAIYISIIFVIPFHYSSLSFSQVILGNFLMHAFASYFLTIALVPSHVSENSIFPLPNKEGVMPYSWSHHQVITTSDFATKNSVITWFLGGFNHHIAHHLFPAISHIHYSKITPIIKKTILEYGLPYKHVDSLFQAYKSHYLLLKNNGKKE